MLLIALLGFSSAPLRAAGDDLTALDRSGPPFVIFAPAPPLPDAIADYPLPDGAEDYWDLWDDDAPWASAADRIDAFAMHAWMVRYSSSDEDLRRMFRWLAEHDIALGLEVEPLTWPGPAVCDHTEGFEGPYDLEVARHIRDLGGEVSFIALDEPFVNAHKKSGEGACGYPVEQVVDEVAAFVREFRVIHPDVLVGSIEPVVDAPRLTARDMATWLDTWQERTGEPFAFLSIDVDWRRDGWPADVREMEAVADERGVPFGMLYLGSEFEDTNDGWLAQFAEHASTFEVGAGGTPDVVGFYSWHSQPDRLLPDDDLDSFTGRINQYHAGRSKLEGPHADRRGRSASGRLLALTGEPLPNRVVRATAEPLDGARLRHELRGTVPTGARRALIAIRANAEGGDPAPVDVGISGVRYRESGESRNRVPNPRFGRGLDGWEPYGAGRVTVTGKGGRARSMRIRAAREQAVFIDGASFTVTPAAAFELAATIDVAGRSIGSGYLSVIFLGDDGRETDRRSLWFTTRPVELPAVTTAADGRYRIVTTGLRPGRYDLVVSYDGDIDRWPAVTSSTITVD